MDDTPGSGRRTDSTAAALACTELGGAAGTTVTLVTCMELQLDCSCCYPVIRGLRLPSSHKMAST